MMMTEPLIDRETLRGWLEAGRPVLLLDVRPAAERSEWATCMLTPTTA